MPYVKIENGVVVQKQPDFTDGFMIVPDTVVCGFLYDAETGMFSKPPAPAPSTDDVWAEKDRRWARGFDYTFPDERGVHHIGTTPKDIEGWTEVSTLAQAAINLQQPDTPIYIETDTGGVTITATEWQNIVIAAAQFRQPIFQAALTIIDMNPIPTDFRNDNYWS